MRAKYRLMQRDERQNASHSGRQQPLVRTERRLVGRAARPARTGISTRSGVASGGEIPRLDKIRADHPSHGAASPGVVSRFERGQGIQALLR